MSRLIWIAALSLLATLLVAPTALGQQYDQYDQVVLQEAGPPAIQYSQEAPQATTPQTTTAAPAQTSATTGAPQIPATGGISLLLPGAALLLGSGILAFAIARRNR